MEKKLTVYNGIKRYVDFLVDKTKEPIVTKNKDAIIWSRGYKSAIADCMRMIYILLREEKLIRSIEKMQGDE